MTRKITRYLLLIFFIFIITVFSIYTYIYYEKIKYRSAINERDSCLEKILSLEKIINLNYSIMAVKLKNTPIIKAEGTGWDSHWVHPYEIIELNKTFIMYYGGSSSGLPRSVGIAKSNNLIDWNKYRNNPIFSTQGGESWESYLVNHFQVIHVNNSYIAFYAGCNDSNRKYNIGMAYSMDGVNWKRYDKNPVLSPFGANEFIVPSKILVRNDRMTMFYWTGTSVINQSTWKVLSADSFDMGKTWIINKSNLILKPKPNDYLQGILDVDVLDMNNSLLLAYQMISMDGRISRIGIAKSTKGKEWKNYGLVYINKSIVSWDSYLNEGPLLFSYKNKLFLIYTGSKGSSIAKKEIGIAQLHLQKVW